MITTQATSRNSMPVVPRYTYRARTYPWAQATIAAAEARHGQPVPTCLHCGGTVTYGRSGNNHIHGICGDCGQPVLDTTQARSGR